MLMSVAGSGKSTLTAPLAKHLGWRWAGSDDFHSPANVATMSAGHALTDDDRWPWLRAILVSGELPPDRIVQEVVTRLHL
jgi:carbohydrate kinase (thermoresistant glucokinase family)